MGINLYLAVVADLKISVNFCMCGAGAVLRLFGNCAVRLWLLSGLCFLTLV